MVLIATVSQLTRYQQVEDKARMRMSFEKNCMKREKRYRKSHERSKDCLPAKEMQENLMESMQHQLQEVEKRRNDLMPEHKNLQKMAQKIQRKNYRKKAWRQEKKCGKSEKKLSGRKSASHSCRKSRQKHDGRCGNGSRASRIAGWRRKKWKQCIDSGGRLFGNDGRTDCRFGNGCKG